MTVFVDTSALYALLDRNDRQHAAAARSWKALIEAREPLATTNYVVVETNALVLTRLGLAAVRVLHDDVLPMRAVHWVTDAQHRAAATAQLLAAKRDLSLVDLTSFEVMGQRGITTAFAFDRHFRERGYPPPRVS